MFSGPRFSNFRLLGPAKNSLGEGENPPFSTGNALNQPFRRSSKEERSLGNKTCINKM